MARWSAQDEERVRRFCEAVVSRQMALPAGLFLEGLRPLHFVGAHFLHFFAPLAGIVVPRWDLQAVGEFVEKPGALEYVIAELERQEKRRAAAARDAKRRTREAKRQRRDGERQRRARGTKP